MCSRFFSVPLVENQVYLDNHYLSEDSAVYASDIVNLQDLRREHTPSNKYCLFMPECGGGSGHEFIAA